MNSPDARTEKTRVIVDRALCIGSGMCTALAPEIFELDDDGVLVLRQEHVAAQALAELDDAIACCPVEALTRVSD